MTLQLKIQAQSCMTWDSTFVPHLKQLGTLKSLTSDFSAFMTGNS